MNADRGLLDWLDQPCPKRGIRFAAPDGGWDFWCYERLARLSCRFASGLIDSRVAARDVVTVVARTGPSLIASLFGTLLAGATPSLLAPPHALHNSASHHRYVIAALTAAKPSLVLVDNDIHDHVGMACSVAGVPAPTRLETLLADVDADVPLARRTPAEFALVQFTSGTSGTARGVRVPSAALAANISAIGQWLEITPQDGAACWLPVHHDMGLIGGLLTPMVHGADVWLMRPEEFVRRPLRYLSCFGTHGARLTAMPGFGLDYLVRRVSSKQLEGMDFSRWRAVIVGAERIRPEVLRRFHQLCGPFGLSSKAVLPAYGLAEATLAVTGLPLAEQWRTIRLEPNQSGLGRSVEHTETGTAVVGCGRDLAGVRTTIVDENGSPVPQGAVGEIAVCSDSLASGYAVGSEPAGSGSHTRFVDGQLRTGDAGVIVDGQLYVLGRLGDALKIRGCMLFAEDLEARLAPLDLPAERFAVVLGQRGQNAVVVGVFEHLAAATRSAARQTLRGGGQGAEVVILDVPRGTIPRTTNGKPKRRELWLSYLSGALAVQSSTPAVPVGEQQTERKELA